MRLICLLLAGFIPQFAFCQYHKLQQQLKEHPFDSLDKYSYLIITYDTSNQPIGTGTGFFYRKQEKLFLVSAYHVFTEFYVLAQKLSKKYPDVMEVWYRDADSDYKCQRIPLRAHNKEPRMASLKFSDVDMMEVSYYFKNVRINSIEQFVSDDSEGGQLSIGDTVVAYGFTHVRKAPDCNANENFPRLPNGYISCAIDTPEIIRNSRNPELLSAVYQYIAPRLKKGVSGAPVFRVKTDESHRRTFEFAGIQALSSKKGKKHSMIVKIKEMNSLLSTYFKQ